MKNIRQDSTNSFVGYLMVITASILFGFNGNVSRLLFDDGVTPITLVEFRMLIGGVCLLVVMLVGWRKGFKLKPRNLIWIIIFGLSLAMVTYTYFVAISKLPIAVALVIQFTAPAVMTVIESVWKRRLPSLYIIVALCLTFGGVIFLTGVWKQSLNGLDTLGLIYAGLSVVAFIFYLLSGRRVGKELPSLTTTTYGALVAGLFWLIIQPPWAIPASTWTPQHMLLISTVGIIGMAIPFSLVLASLRRLDATRVGIASMLELVAAGGIAYIWLGQHLDLWQILGCFLVIIGVTILQIEARMTAQPEAA